MSHEDIVWFWVWSNYIVPVAIALLLGVLVAVFHVGKSVKERRKRGW